MRSKSEPRRSCVLLGGELDLVNADERRPLLELLVDRLENAGDDELLLGLAVASSRISSESRAFGWPTSMIEDVAIRVDRARAGRRGAAP